LKREKEKEKENTKTEPQLPGFRLGSAKADGGDREGPYGGVKMVVAAVGGHIQEPVWGG
jgi:hypothetical protein